MTRAGVTPAGTPPGGSPERLRDSSAARGLLVVLALAAATVATVALEDLVGLADASPIYLVAVVIAASLLGTSAAIATSLGSFLIYDFLFTAPRFTFAIAEPAEWLSLLLFLLVAVVLGRVTALVRDRADMADRRAREAVALVAISRDISLAASFAEASAIAVNHLRNDAEMAAVWVALARQPDVAIAIAGTPPEPPGPTPWALSRTGADGGPEWIRVHGGGAVTAPEVPDAGLGERYVADIDGPGGLIGWLHASREPGAPRPGRGARRLLALAADQLAAAHHRDELAAELTAAEVARQSDHLRAAILDSVSHDLRTPIASIRALAGGLADAAVQPEPAAVQAAATAIDREGARLGGLVNGLLDMGRIQAGAVQPDLQPYDLAELVETSLRDHPARTGGVALELPEDLPPVLADAVLFGVALGNVLENASRHAAGARLVRLRATATDDGHVVLDVDDDGPGVPDAALASLFIRFYRAPGGPAPARQGIGLGLAIAKGFMEAMGGTIGASRSDLGGLRVTISLPAAPAEDVG